jgi:tRNA-(ms[2]io[6]A)-hydroxylase
LCSFFTADDGTQLWVISQLGDALPLVPTGPQWIEVAMSDLDAVHADHLHCERKAAQSALSLMRSYPDRADLVAAMARLAHDETRHVIQVSQLISRRAQAVSYDHGDDYAAALREHVRKREPDRLLDRLLVFAVIEGRSAERLDLLARALPDPQAAQLYASLATAEVRHRDIFLALARDTSPTQWQSRAIELASVEEELLRDRPVVARIH